MSKDDLSSLFESKFDFQSYKTFEFDAYINPVKARRRDSMGMML
jgi:hypothetical protein